MTAGYRLSSSSGAVLDQVTIVVEKPVGFAIHGVGPNPARHMLVLQLAGDRACPVRLSSGDVAGRLVWTDAGESGPQDGECMTLRLPESLTPGGYVPRVSSAAGHAQRRFVMAR